MADNETTTSSSSNPPVIDIAEFKGKKIAENMYEKGHTRHFFSKEYMAEKLEKFKIIKIRKTSSVYHDDKSNFIEGIATK